MDLTGLTKKQAKSRGRTVYYENDFGEILGKQCGSCGTVKSLSEFAKNKNSVGGRESACKDCRSVTRRERHERNREKDAKLMRNWYKANKDRHLEVVRNWKRNNSELSEKIKRDWTRNNPELRALSEQRRRARKNSLPDDFTAEQMSATLEYFGGCALTGSRDTHWDHAIPLSTGWGGTTSKNMIPLRSYLNCSKHDNNIFEWFTSNRQRFNLEQERFDRLIEWLGKANGMTVEEYRDYVYECHGNPNVLTDDDAAI